MGQLVRAVIDYGWITFMGWWLSHHEMVGAVPGDRYINGILLMAAMLIFAAASYNLWVVAWNVVAALASFFISQTIDGFSVPVDVQLFVCAAFVCVGGSVAMLSRYIRDMFLSLRKRDNLTRFLAPQVAEHVMNLGDTALAPVQREVTVLFSDIRDFTALSEKLPPEQVLAMLDEYFGHMGQIVKGREGIVNKFIGDGMLAFWNVPDRDERHALHAIQAALDMRTKLRELNEHRAVFGQPPLRIGVGVHTGMVAAGMLGGADQHEYTVIGDAVNVASRVEGLTKPLGCEILVTESTWALLGGKFAGRRVAEEKVKGREQPVVVYALELEGGATVA
jgi:adenylate cyclase